MRYLKGTEIQLKNSYVHHYFNQYFIQGQNDMKRIMKKNHARNKYVNKRFATFPIMIKHETHIDNRTKTFESSYEFLRSFVKCLKMKFLYPIKRSMRMLSFKMRNLRGLKKISLTSNHEYFSSRQHSEAEVAHVAQKN